MKKITILLFIAAALSLAFSVGSDSSTSMLNNVVIRFEGTNGYGNNLWVDNFSIGNRTNNDLGIYAFSLADRNYLLPGVTSTSVSPTVTIINAGRTVPTGANVTLMAVGGSYTSTKPVSSISAGSTTQVTFDPINFNLNTAQNLRIYISWTSDQNSGNDTVNQSTVYLTGVKRKVLFEAHTSSTCGPCALQNPYLDAFIQTKFDSIVPIKYHTWWLAPGNDPMYFLNPGQVRVRTQLNQVSAVPTLQVDGVHQQVSGYSTPDNLLNPFNTRMSKASPVAISVTDVRIAGDSIKATVNVQVVAQLPSNADYRLRLAAIERKITYPAPLYNGESIFYDVFRRMYPTTDGASINTVPGNYVYEIKYKREAEWIDSMIYSAVFIQNEYTHEIINCNKARNYYDKNIIELPKTTPVDLMVSTNTFPEYSPFPVTGGIVVENFENTLPPPGWSITNPDSSFTFWQYIYTAVNGPSFPGSKSARINYYSYSNNLGTMDYLRSPVYNNVNLSDTIKFDWAYARRPGYSDRLVVKVSTDGGSSFPFTIFDKSGSTLGTAPDLSSGFTPTSSQWGTFSISMSSALTAINPGVGFAAVDYELIQNYPNPFNPSTTIGYVIGTKGFVSLKVYDALGKEIETLVNSEMLPGNYTAEFNAGKLSSGIYFYKLEINGFADVKRMVFVK